MIFSLDERAGIFTACELDGTRAPPYLQTTTEEVILEHGVAAIWLSYFGLHMFV